MAATVEVAASTVEAAMVMVEVATEVVATVETTVEVATATVVGEHDWEKTVAARGVAARVAVAMAEGPWGL